VDHEAHEGHEDGADLAAACGGRAGEEESRPTRSGSAPVPRLVGSRLSLTPRPGEARQVSGRLKTSQPVGSSFVDFVFFVVQRFWQVTDAGP